MPGKLTKSLLGTFMVSLISLNLHASDASEAIDKVNAQFESGFTQGDAKIIADVYTPDGQLLPPNSEVITGAGDILAFWQGALDMGIAKAELDTVELDEQGDTAIEIGQYVLSDDSGNSLDKGKYIVVWKNGSSGWKYHRDMWSSSLTPK